jgi:hypothetical protein
VFPAEDPARRPASAQPPLPMDKCLWRRRGRAARATHTPGRVVCQRRRWPRHPRRIPHPSATVDHYPAAHRASGEAMTSTTRRTLQSVPTDTALLPHRPVPTACRSCTTRSRRRCREASTLGLTNIRSSLPGLPAHGAVVWGIAKRALIRTRGPGRRRTVRRRVKG